MEESDAVFFKSQIKNRKSKIPSWPREVEMRNRKALASPSHAEGLHGAEMRRRIADCRERLRRKRAARRIAERASPRVEGLAVEGPESALLVVAFGPRGEKP